MWGSAEDMRGGLDAFFEENAKMEGKCLVDYYQFDGKIEHVHSGVPVGYVKAVLEPRGSTALLDAVGKAVTELGSSFARKRDSERPGKVIVVIVTDGMENASTEWTRKAVRDLVREQEDKYNWEFIFLGANMDAVAEGGLLGIRPDRSLTFNVNSNEAILATSQSLVAYAGASRGGGEYKFSDEERLAAVSS